MWKKILLSPWTALLTLALVVSIRIADPVFVESVRLRYFDTLIVDRTATANEQIHVVNIDDAAIAKFGQFPFPRNQYAAMPVLWYSTYSCLMQTGLGKTQHWLSNSNTV
jgi:CHASE2 domain-containing sensor protein